MLDRGNCSALDYVRFLTTHLVRNDGMLCCDTFAFGKDPCLSKQRIEERLDGLLKESYRHVCNNGLDLFMENRIFTNRNIKLNRIKAVGFDMDYTLAQYEQAALEKLTMGFALRILVKEHGYPESILGLPYEADFAIRGLIVDTELGNVLKMDKFHYVSLACHGLTTMESDIKTKCYNTKRINYDSERYRSVDTLFELLETYLYGAIIDHLERVEKREVDFKALFQHLRGAIDRCHGDGTLKQEIMSHPELYIKDDPLLVPALHQFREAGKRLFVITNSEPEYTDFMLSYLFRNANPFFKSWRHCFEIVGTLASKPLFFTEGRPLEILEEKDTLFFSGGNLDFLEQRLGITGDQVLYVGDHIYGDILKSKHNSTWRTCIIVPELSRQIRAEQQALPFLRRLTENDSRRKQLTMELNWRRSQLLDLHQFKESEADELDRDHLARIDHRIGTLNRQLEANHKELSKLLFESRKLRKEISASFNKFWGRLFKTGGQLSLFAEQIRDYACIYTSSVSNFNFYGPHSYLESTVTPMPHEINLYSLADLNFDISMDCDQPRVNEEIAAVAGFTPDDAQKIKLPL